MEYVCVDMGTTIVRMPLTSWGTLVHHKRVSTRDYEAKDIYGARVCIDFTQVLCIYETSPELREVSNVHQLALDAEAESHGPARRAIGLNY